MRATDVPGWCRAPVLAAILLAACDTSQLDTVQAIPAVAIVDDLEYRAVAEPHPEMLSVRIEITNRGPVGAVARMDLCSRIVAFESLPATGAEAVWEEDADCGQQRYTELPLAPGGTVSITKGTRATPLEPGSQYYLGIRFRTAPGREILLSGGAERVTVPLNRVVPWP